MFSFNVTENTVEKGNILILLISLLLVNDMAGVNAQETGAPWSIGHLNMELWNFYHSIYIAAPLKSIIDMGNVMYNDCITYILSFYIFLILIFNQK